MPDEVILRPFQPNDEESFFRFVYRDPTLWESFGLDHEPVLEEAREYIRARVACRFRPRFHDYAVVKNGEVIGEVNAAIIPEDIADIGYVIGSQFRRRGCGFSAVKTLLNLLEEDGIHRVFAATRRDNAASIGLLEKLGMHSVPKVPEAVLAREEGGPLIFFHTALPTRKKNPES